MNVGASSETDYGNYYKYGSGATAGGTDNPSYYGGMENPLRSLRDTASQVWGGLWHTPTQTQMQELTANTTYTWKTNFNGSGVNGGKFTSKIDTSKYIFLPAAGVLSEGSWHGVRSYGYYWSSTPFSNYNTYYAYCFYYNSDVDTNTIDGFHRSWGCSVRPVIG